LVFATGRGGPLLLTDAKVMLNLPHVASSWGWETTLVLDNVGDESDTVEIQYINRSTGSMDTNVIQIEPGKQLVQNLDQMDSGMLVLDNPKTRARVSYVHDTELGIAEFETEPDLSRTLDLNLPHYLYTHLT